MKRPHGFEMAIEVANHDDGFANISISKELVLELDNYIFQLEAKRDATQPRKTVSDAVDYFDGVWPENGRGIIFFDDNEGWKCWIADWEPCHDFYQVCTREEFEAEVERRKGEEVFRLVGSSDLVKVVYEGRDGIVCVANEDNDIFVVKKEDLRKRKPTISKAEAWDKAVSEDVSPFYIIENYEVK